MRPLLIFVLFAICSPWIDWQLSHWIYQYHGGFYHNDLTAWLFTYGTWPAWITSFISVAFLFNKKYRKTALLFLLTFALSNLIVNGILKELWPRPRPVQVIGLGGSYPFRAFWYPLYDGMDHKSFPSGHAASGFVFFALYHAGRTFKMPALKIWGLVLGLAFGITLSALRIAMGGHFFFDTVFSAALLWYLPQTLLKVRFLWKS